MTIDTHSKIYRQLRAVRNSIDSVIGENLPEKLADQLIRTQNSIQAALNAIAAAAKKPENSEN